MILKIELFSELRDKLSCAEGCSKKIEIDRLRCKAIIDNIDKITHED